MRRIEGALTAELSEFIGDTTVEASEPFPAQTYRQLVEHVAKLAYQNKDHLLFFRGQDQDYVNRAGSSSFYPSIYRGDYLSQREVNYRFDVLDGAARQLKIDFSSEEIQGYREVSRKRYIQWSILQHYGVCVTPLLDFTHSLRVACSFAQIDNPRPNGYVFAFGLPYLTNRITINSEHDLVNVRLLSICPPDALRPYFQEGYLAGTGDITNEYETKTELDFKNRLIAKFIIPNETGFWGRGFSRIPKTVLYPRDDRVGKLCEAIRDRLPTEILPGQLGEFVQEWTGLETNILTKTREQEGRVLTVSEAINKLEDLEMVDQETGSALQELRKLRDQVVHDPEQVDEASLTEQTQRVKEVKKKIT